jgi:hypothetical protein
MTDSDSDSSRAKPDSRYCNSKGEARFVAEKRAANLEEEVASLTKENTNLRAQFAEVVRISSQFDEVYHNNQMLTASIRDVQAESESLKQRLEISIRANADISEKLESEKKAAFARRDGDHRLFRQELHKAKRQAKSQIESIYAQLQLTQDEKGQLEIKQRFSQSKLGTLLHSAQFFFNLTFPDVDSLTKHLSQTEISKPPPVQQPPAGASKKLKSLSARFRAANAARDDLENQVARLQRERIERENRHKQQIADIETKHRRELEDCELADADHSHLVQALEAKVEALSGALNSQKCPEPTAVSQTAPITPSVPPVAVSESAVRQSVRQSKEAEFAVDRLLQGNVELVSQVQTPSAKSESYLGKLESAEQAKAEMETVMKKAESERDALALVHKETVCQLATVRAALRQKESHQDKREKRRLKREISLHKAEIASLQRTVDRQQKEIQDLSIAKNDANRTIDQQTQMITQLKRSLSEDARTIEQLKADLTQTEHKLGLRSIPTADDLLPPTVWRSLEFPSELNGQIANIAANTALQPSSKLHNIYHAVNGFFTKQIQSRDQALDEAYTDNQTIRATLHKFLVTISIALRMKPVTFSDFFGQEGDNLLATTIADLRRDYDDLERFNDQLAAVFAHFHEQLGLEDDGQLATTIQQITLIRDRLDKQTRTIKQKSEKCRILNREMKDLIQKFEVDSRNTQLHITQLSEELSGATQSNEDLVSQNTKLKQDLQKLRREFRELRLAAEDCKTGRVEEREPVIQRAHPSQMSIEDKLCEELRVQKQQCAETSELLVEATATIKILKATIVAQKATISEKENELAQNRRESNANEQALIEQQETEKRKLTDKYERALSQIRR